jgi:hypothetical protein
MKWWLAIAAYITLLYGNTQTHRLDLAEGVELIDMLDVLYTIGCQVLPYILEEACYETSRYSRS